MNDFVGPGRFAGRNRPSAAPGTGTAAENIVVPAVTGNTLAGETLTADDGSWIPAEGTLYTYQWYRDGEAIDGAINGTYILQDADIGKTIYVIVRADAANYSYAQSNSVGPIGAAEYLDYYLSTHRWLKYDGGVVFDIPFTPENWENPLVSDRFDYVNYMYIGVGTSNGYVLGTLPVPAAEGARTWSLSGTDAAIFAIDSSTGEITLADAASVTAAGNLSITVTASDLGDYDITVPVVDDSSGVGFISDAGDDSNSGKQPHVPKATIAALTAMSATVRCGKRGSEWVGETIQHGSNKTWQCFGDPSQPAPKATGTDDEIFVVRGPYKANDPAQGFLGQTNVTITDWTLAGGAICQRPIYIENVSGVTVKRVKSTNNIEHPNSQGFGFKNCTNVTFRHCETDDTIFGDNLYGVYDRVVEVGFFYAPPANGTVADCIEFTDELKSTTRCSDIYIHNSILMQRPDTNSLKGACVVEGTDRWMIEDCYIRGKYFGIGAAGNHCTVRNLFVNDCRLPSTNSNRNNTWGIGCGTPYANTEQTYHGNIINRAARGISVSGYNNPPPHSDMEISENTVLNCFVNAVKFTEAWSGYYSDNIHQDNVSNSVVEIGNGAVTATYTEVAIASMTRSGSTVTVTCAGFHYLAVNDDAPITGANESDYNGTWTVTEVVSEKAFRFDIGVATPTTPATGSLKLRKTSVYSTRDKTNNTSQTGSGPEFTVVPTISGTCQEGEDVTVTATAPAGSTLSYQWYINCKKIGSGDTSATLTIPAGASDMTQTRVPLGFGLSTPDLCVIVTATDGSGRKRKVPGIWPSGAVHEDIAPPAPADPVAPSNTNAPVVSGTLTVGEVLTTTDGTWDGDPTITYEYQWIRSGVNIDGEIGSTYTLVEDDVGERIKCAVTATNGAGSATANSASVLIPVSAIPDLGIWYDASDTDTLLTSSGSVDQANDKSGNDYNATATVKPTTGRNLNGLNALNHNGVDQRLDLPSSAFGLPNGNYTVMMVAATDVTNASQRIISAIDNSIGRLSLRLDYGNSQILGYGGTTSTVALAVTPDTGQHVFGLVHNGSTVTVHYDASTASGSVGGNFTATSWNIGRLAGSGTDDFDGAFAEMVFFTRVLTTDELAAVKRYLKAKWSTP